MVKVVSNASPIIGLIKIQKLYLLWELFDEIYITSVVYDEIMSGNAKRDTNNSIQALEEAVNAKRIKIYEVADKQLVEKLYGKLHKGELETIIAAKELDIEFVIIDEKAARNLAESFLLTPIGIVGVILFAKSKSRIEAVKPLLEELISSGFRTSDKIYKWALEQAGETE